VSADEYVATAALARRALQDLLLLIPGGLAALHAYERALFAQRPEPPETE
jgi:hypothetical protein